MPPSYHEAISMSETQRRSDIVEEKWTCTICTFQNHHLMDICETCEMPRISGIKITGSSYHPLLENNHLQRASSVPTNDNNNSNNNKNNQSSNSNNVMHATAL